GRNAWTWVYNSSTGTVAGSGSTVAIAALKARSVSGLYTIRLPVNPTIVITTPSARPVYRWILKIHRRRWDARGLRQSRTRLFISREQGFSYKVFYTMKANAVTPRKELL